jgi:hypothetical protein
MPWFATPGDGIATSGDKSFALDNAVLTLRGRVAWAHDFDPNRSIAATFQALPGASFVVNGAALAGDSALTTASAELKWTNGWSAAATFEGEFSNVTPLLCRQGFGPVSVVSHRRGCGRRRPASAEMTAGRHQKASPDIEAAAQIPAFVRRSAHCTAARPAIAKEEA